MTSAEVVINCPDNMIKKVLCTKNPKLTQISENTPTTKLFIIWSKFAKPGTTSKQVVVLKIKKKPDVKESQRWKWSLQSCHLSKAKCVKCWESPRAVCSPNMIWYIRWVCYMWRIYITSITCHLKLQKLSQCPKRRPNQKDKTSGFFQSTISFKLHVPSTSGETGIMEI